MKNNIIDLAISLCEIPSVSGNEVDCLNFLSNYLQAHEFIVEKLPVDNNRYNIFAYFKKLPKYSLMFCTHIDTVPPFIAPKLSESTLFGRGVCDAKGILATMIYALIDAKANGYDDMALLFTVGEETISDGAKAVNDLLADKSQFLVIGEPTQNQYAKAQKGAVVFDIMANGVETHSSTPRLGHSAIHDLLEVCSRIIKHQWPKDDTLGETLVNIGCISGGYARNILAKEAKAQGVMRLSIKSRDAIKELEKLIPPKVFLQILSFTDPFYYYVPEGFKGFVAGFGTDAPFLEKVGKAILMGPGNLHYAHKDNEQIEIDELYQGFLAYKDLIGIINR